MSRIARVLRTAALLACAGCWPAQRLRAEEFDEPAVAQAIRYEAECSPDPPAAPREYHRRLRLDSERWNRDNDGTRAYAPLVAEPPDLDFAPRADLPFDPPGNPSMEDRSLELAPGASTEWLGPGPLDLPTVLDDDEAEGLTVRERLWWEVGNLWHDFGNYYLRWPTYGKLAVAFGVGAALANSEADERVEDWYQAHVRNHVTDHASTFFRGFGAGMYAIPGWVGVGLVGAYFDESPWGNVAAQFGFQTTRAILVGAPALIFAQYATGGSRPDETTRDSHWHPFADTNGVSGHTYIGAIPFLTAARMTDSPWLKALLYVGSVAPGWSRLDDNAHFLSQVILGWCMAYVACDAVAETEESSSFVITPVVSDRMAGIGLLLRY